MSQTSIPQNIVTKNSSIRSSTAPCQSGLTCIVQESKRAKLESHKKNQKPSRWRKSPSLNSVKSANPKIVNVTSITDRVA